VQINSSSQSCNARGKEFKELQEFKEKKVGTTELARNHGAF